ncbi:MAG: glycosyltransferase family 39 protein [Vicingaceae bacterium]
MKLLNRFSGLIFVLFLVLLGYLYSYFEIINDPADGIHVWRQTDGLSIAQKFFEEGNSLFKPEMHNRLGGEGKAAGEFPFMYYIVSIFYHIFGVHNWVFRSVWILTSMIGYYFLYRFCADLLKDKIWAMLISLFTFTSPILIVYGASFLPDPIALAFIFIAWYYLYKYVNERNRKHLVITCIFVVLSATLKITSLLSILAFAVVLGASLLIKRIRWQISTQALIYKFIPFVISFLVIFAWYYYASWYNKVNETSYFYLRSAPIWSLSSQEINEVALRLKGWSREYFYATGLHCLYAFALLTIIPISKKELKSPFYWIYFFSILGFIAFVALFYSQFSYHDYYVINLLFIIPLTLIFWVKKYGFILQKRRWINYTFQGLFLVLLIASVIHGKRRAEERFAIETGWLDKDLYELREQLESYGMDQNDLVLVPHDPSSNITLYAINMNGWTALNSIREPRIFQEKIDQGAKWLIVSDSSYYDNSIIDPYRDKLQLDFKGIRVYNLQ